MGYHAAVNVHQMMLSRADPSRKPAFLDIDEFLPRMVLAVGKSAVRYTPGNEIASGEDVLKQSFSDDLGLAGMSSPLLWQWSGMVLTECSDMGLYAAVA